MAVFRSVLKAAAFVLVFTFIEAVFALILLPDNLPSRFMVEDMYEQEAIDVLIIGSSLTMTGIDPYVLGEKLSQNCFNASSHLQQPVASYYLLKDILRRYSPKTVIFSANLSTFGAGTLDALQSNLILYDYMRPSAPKLQFFASAFKPADYPNVLFKSYHYRGDFTLSMLRPSYIVEKARKPRGTRINEYTEYIGRGFTAYTAELDGTGDLSFVPPPEIDAKKKDWLKKLIALCRDNGAEVVLLTMPRTRERVLSLPDMFRMENAFFAGIAGECGARHIDLNLAKDSFLPLDNRHFKDSAHLNAAGAAEVSGILAGLLNGGEGEFYGNMDDLLASLRG